RSINNSSESNRAGSRRDQRVAIWYLTKSLPWNEAPNGGFVRISFALPLKLSVSFPSVPLRERELARYSRAVGNPNIARFVSARRTIRSLLSIPTTTRCNIVCNHASRCSFGVSKLSPSWSTTSARKEPTPHDGSRIKPNSEHRLGSDRVAASEGDKPLIARLHINRTTSFGVRYCPSSFSSMKESAKNLPKTSFKMSKPRKLKDDVCR